MSKLLRATNVATRGSLEKALSRAAKMGNVSTVETLLGALIERFPQSGVRATLYAENALQEAVSSKKWSTVSYLAQYLEDTAPPRRQLSKDNVVGGTSYTKATSEYVEQEVLHCLREEVVRAKGKFVLTDYIEDKCIDKDVRFAREVALAQCPIRFLHVDPKYPPEQFGGSQNPSGYFSIANPDASRPLLLEPDEKVVPSGFITVRVTTPSQFKGVYQIETAGDRLSLATAISDLYKKLYREVGHGSKNLTVDIGELDLRGVIAARDGTHELDVVAGT
jgi:hypothetical protein